MKKRRLSLTKRGSNDKSEQLASPSFKNGAIKATEALEESKEPLSGSSQEDDEQSPFFDQLINGGKTSFDASLISAVSLNESKHPILGAMQAAWR